MHFYDSNFKQKGKKNCCRAILDNISKAPICVPEKYDRVKKNVPK